MRCVYSSLSLLCLLLFLCRPAISSHTSLALLKVSSCYVSMFRCRGRSRHISREPKPVSPHRTFISVTSFAKSRGRIPTSIVPLNPAGNFPCGCVPARVGAAAGSPVHTQSTRRRGKHQKQRCRRDLWCNASLGLDALDV